MHNSHFLAVRSFAARHRAIFTGLVILLLALPAPILLLGGALTHPAPTPAPTAGAVAGLASLPLSFEPNVGQTDPAVRFMAHASSGVMYFTPSEVVLTLSVPYSTNTTTDNVHRPADKTMVNLSGKGPGLPAPASISTDSEQALAPVMVRMRFDGANENAEIAADNSLPGKVNYLLGSDSSKWHTNLPTYRDIHYSELYPGIDLSYSGNSSELKGTYTIASAADPSVIRWTYQSVSDIQLDDAGNLKVNIEGSTPITLTEQLPIAWQDIDGKRIPVRVGYALDPAGSVHFRLGSYNTTYPLMINPSLTYSTMPDEDSIGNEYTASIAVHSSGNAYVVGYTESTNFPIANAFQSTNHGASDAFVTKLNAAGSALVYSTYLGGSSYDKAYGIAVDTNGNAYVAGYTESTNFPIANAFQSTNHGASDAFVTKLNAAGSALVYSTYLGGSSYEDAQSIAVDTNGNAYVAGGTTSTNFPIANPFQPTIQSVVDAFITKLNAAGSALVYSTYLGGNWHEYAQSIAVDTNGNAYITGYTHSTNFPIANAFQPTYHGGDWDAFVTKLNAAGSALVYSTYLGGGSYEWAFSIAIDTNGNAYVAGHTTSTNFPIANAFQPAMNGWSDAFVTKLNAAGSALVYSTYLGGSAGEGADDIIIGTSGNAYITGGTASTDFPIANAFQPTRHGYGDAFITKLNAAGSALVYSTYLGGGSYDSAQGIAIDSGGNAYITGDTSSTDFPIANPFQPTYHGERDAFVTKLNATGSALVYSTYLGGGSLLTMTTPSFQHMSYPQQAWVTLPGDRTTDGNIVKVEVTIHNSASISQSLNLWFHDLETGIPLPAGPSSRANGAPITVPAGAPITVEYRWDTAGFAWDQDWTSHSLRTIKASLRNSSNQEIIAETQSLTVMPKPVILVHGINSDAGMWNDYGGYLQGVSPYWHGYAVGDHQFSISCAMNTKYTPTLYMDQNAAQLACYIEGVRDNVDAWHVDIVAHSMGGLFSRYYIKHLMPDIPSVAGIGPVATHLVMLGTPNEGSPCADNPAFQAAWPQPAIYELTTDYVQNYFNPYINNTRGVLLSALAGDPLRVCSSEWSDSVVPISSARPTWLVSDAATNSSYHIPVFPWAPYLTSAENFDNFVKHKLAVGTSVQAEVVTAVEKSRRSNLNPIAGGNIDQQIVLSDTRQIPAGITIDIPLTVTEASHLGFVYTGPSSLASALLDPQGAIVDSIDANSARSGQPFTGLTTQSPMPGNWTLRLHNTDTSAVEVGINAWVEGSPLRVDLTIGQPQPDGSVSLVASITNGGSPVNGATVEATLSMVNIPDMQVSLVDQGGNGIYTGVVHLTAVGLYSVVVDATVSVTTLITTGVVDVTNLVLPTTTPTAVPTICPIQFTDVPQGSTFYPFVRCLACLAIINGYPCGTPGEPCNPANDPYFRPNNPVTRGQLSKVVSNAAGFSEPHTEPLFEDVPFGSTFYDVVARLASRQIVSGYPCGGSGEPCVPPANLPYFRPNAGVTRGQTSKVVAIAAQLPAPPTGQQSFQDVSEGNTFWLWVEALAGIGAINGYPCGGPAEPCVSPSNLPYFRPGAGVTRGQSAKIVSNTFFPACQTP